MVVQCLPGQAKGSQESSRPGAVDGDGVWAIVAMSFPGAQIHFQPVQARPSGQLRPLPLLCFLSSTFRSYQEEPREPGPEEQGGLVPARFRRTGP